MLDETRETLGDGERLMGRGRDARDNFPSIAGFALLALLLACLLGRMMSMPLGRDENLFVTVSALSSGADIYRDLGYNHLPLMPWLLGALYWITGAVRFLLMGRLLVFAGWIAALFALWFIARVTRAGAWGFLASAVLLLCNVLLLGPPGMLATNNFLPVPLTLFAIGFLIWGLDRDQPSALYCLIAGIFATGAIALKVNYIFLAPFLALATVLAPTARPLGRRLMQGTLPLALGGLFAGLPVLLAMASDPQAFFAHTLRYFTQVQPAYWTVSTEPKVMSVAQKVLLGEDVWTANATLLTLAGITVLAALPFVRSGAQAGIATLLSWPVVITAALAAMGFVMAFVPSPSFPQYFVPPIPFLLVLLLLLRARTAPIDRPAADAVLIALMLVALLCAMSRLGPGLVSLARPARWEPVSLHRDARALAREAGFSGGETAVALTPAIALEGGFTVPHEFAAGQFVYRVGDLIAPEDRQYYTTTSPTRLVAFLNSAPPPAILVNGDEPLERAFADYARARGYTEFVSRGKHRQLHLFRRPGLTAPAAR
ncbi:hypothetical protein [Novosphingobium sp. BL-8H]|uniref:hypothetical protein n=1 Tax=Novosphingobium sp. BL-8H TaxID=3127640 RepID=UPI0037564E8B